MSIFHERPQGSKAPPKARRWVAEACHSWLSRFRKILMCWFSLLVTWQNAPSYSILKGLAAKKPHVWTDFHLEICQISRYDTTAPYHFILGEVFRISIFLTILKISFSMRKSSSMNFTPTCSRFLTPGRYVSIFRTTLAFSS
jgi:hypothetical protein